MKRYKKLLVPLSLQAGDSIAIKWAAKISHLAESQEVLFCHNLELPELPETALEKYPWLKAPLDSQVSDQMEKLVDAHWNGREEAHLDYLVTSKSSAVFSILEAVLDQETDLVVVSQQSFGRDLPIRLARKAPCSVMALPDQEEIALNHIMVPTDFSTYSEAALDVGLAFAEAEGLAQLDSVHIFNLGNFSHRVTLPEKDLIQMEEDFVEGKHQKYLEQQNLRGLDVRPFEIFHNLIGAGIFMHAREKEADLIVAGCRGRNTVTSLLLGSNAEELLRQARVPVIAAKQKGTGQGLLEAMLNPE